MMRRVVSLVLLSVVGFCLAWACGFDNSLREYLTLNFWFPLAKSGRHVVTGKGPQLDAPYAGMTKVSASGAKSPLDRLRSAYQHFDGRSGVPTQLLAAARASSGLSAREREEVELLDAKFDLRSSSEKDSDAPLQRAEKKLTAFLSHAKTPEYLSEARGWLGYIHRMFSDQTAAGKIYLDELNREDSNLSRQTLLASLRMTYGYDGGDTLRQHLDEYFDTPAHAAFAIQLVTNPRWNRSEDGESGEPVPGKIVSAFPPYERIRTLLDQHRSLFRTEAGANQLAELGMRNALRAADPKAALRIAAAVPPRAAIRRDADFLWMLGSAYFLTHQYAAAEAPLTRLFASPATAREQRAAAAYGLCGVYEKLHRPVDQIRYAAWLEAEHRNEDVYLDSYSIVEDYTIYYAVSGWDLAFLLESEAPIEALQEYIEKYPKGPDLRLVQYSLGVRLARENRYEEAAEVFGGIHANLRAQRMRTLAQLYRESLAPGPDQPQARFKLAEFINANSECLYFNDQLWRGLQRYAFTADQDGRLTREEHQRLVAGERKLKDDQEEHWRAYLLLRDVVQDPDTDVQLRRRAAKLAVQSLRQISERFGREADIRNADIALSRAVER